MSIPTDRDSFVELLARSRLFDADRIARIRRERTESDDDPQSLAAELVSEGTISRWQADRLLAGRHRGFVLGPYLLRDRLGRGGMGTVYLADALDDQRRLAIKVLDAGPLPDDSIIVERFHREARAAAELDHPNIVRAYALEREARRNGDLHYLVMEYVVGLNLAQLIDRDGPLDVEPAVDLVRQTAEGLDHAHRHGLIHRDVKPANVMLDGTGVVKVLDLGLALVAEELREGHDFAQVSDDMIVLGTADYMSPEQARDSHAADARSDLYSLGCTFYFMLAGHPPFLHATVVQRLLAHQREAIPRIRTVRPNVPEAIASIIARLTEKDPDDRFQSADELAERLRTWQRHTKS